MKTPDEIKKDDFWYRTIMYRLTHENMWDEHCPGSLTLFGRKQTAKLALAYIQQLESTYSQVSKALCGKENATLDELLTAANQLKSRLAQVEKERDAAVSDLVRSKYCPVCVHHTKDGNEEPCKHCINNTSKLEWRGVCAENSKEDSYGKDQHAL